MSPASSCCSSAASARLISAGSFILLSTASRIEPPIQATILNGPLIGELSIWKSIVVSRIRTMWNVPSMAALTAGPRRGRGRELIPVEHHVDEVVGRDRRHISELQPGIVGLLERLDGPIQCRLRRLLDQQGEMRKHRVVDRRQLLHLDGKGRHRLQELEASCRALVLERRADGAAELDAVV